MTMDEMAAAAMTIHRAPGLVDLTINGDDSLQVVSNAAKTSVSVDFNVVAGKQAGVKANWYVLCQGPKGWTSLQTVTTTTVVKGKKTTTTTTKWVKGTLPLYTQVAIADVPNTTASLNVLQTGNLLSVKLPSTTLPAGAYTYWVGIVPNGGAENFVSVPLIVTP